LDTIQSSQNFAIAIYLLWPLVGIFISTNFFFIQEIGFCQLQRIFQAFINNYPRAFRYFCPILQWLLPNSSDIISIHIELQSQEEVMLLEFGGNYYKTFYWIVSEFFRTFWEQILYQVSNYLVKDIISYSVRTNIIRIFPIPLIFTMGLIVLDRQDYLVVFNIFFKGKIPLLMKIYYSNRSRRSL
jgi:hypothetical protein